MPDRNEKLYNRLARGAWERRDDEIMRLNERIKAEEAICNAYRDGLYDMAYAIENEEQDREDCPFCRENDRKALDSECGEISFWIATCTPFPAINLTTGETAAKAEDPYFILDVQHECGAADSVKIHYCPICGRKL